MYFQKFQYFGNIDFILSFMNKITKRNEKGKENWFTNR